MSYRCVHKVRRGYIISAKHPNCWTKDEVGVWLRWCTEEYSIEPVPPEKFDLNGQFYS